MNNNTIKILDQAIADEIIKNPVLQLEQARIERIFDLAESIRNYRKGRGLTQDDLAKKIGKTQPFIARLENPTSDREPSLATLSMLAQAMDLDLSIEMHERELACA